MKIILTLKVVVIAFAIIELSNVRQLQSWRDAVKMMGKCPLIFWGGEFWGVQTQISNQGAFRLELDWNLRSGRKEQFYQKIE